MEEKGEYRPVDDVLQTDQRSKGEFNSADKNYKMPMINIIPAIVWSIPFHQKSFPNAGW